VAQQDDPNLTDTESLLLDDVARQCGMSSLRNPLASRDAWGNRIQIAFSEGRQRYLLKEFPRYCHSDSETSYFFSVQDWARNGGTPIPRFRVTLDGDRAIKWEGRRFAVQEFVGNAHDPGNHKQIENCAVVLGLYHRTVGAFRPDEGMKPGLGDWNAVSISEHNLKQVKEDIDRRPIAGTSRSVLLQMHEKLEEAFEETKQRTKSIGWWGLSRIHVHGDFHQFNCRYEGNRVVGLVDFDNSRLEPRLYDVAHGINIMLGLAWHSERQIDTVWRTPRQPQPHSLARWLLLYTRYAPPLSEVELKLLPLACALVWPEVFAGFYRNSTSDTTGCERASAYMRYLVDNAVRVSDEIAEGVACEAKRESIEHRTKPCT